MRNNIPCGVEKPAWFVRDLELKFHKLRIAAEIISNPC